MSRRFENDIRAWVDAQGSGVTDEGDMARDYALIAGTDPLYPITNNQDIVFTTLGPAVGVTYSNVTGIITLGIGKTYLLQSSCHTNSFSNPASEWAGYAFVNTANVRVGFGTVAISLSATYTFNSSSNSVCSTIHTTTSAADNQVKLRIDAVYSGLAGTAAINQQYSFITVQQMG